MRLVSLSLQNYRKFSDVQVEFPDGVTGIIGLNGVGKSSLVEAIAWVLYGHDATRTKKEGIKRSQASRDTDCIASLKLEISGDSYEISRALRGVNLSTDARIAVNGKEWARSADKTTREVVKLLGMVLLQVFLREAEGAQHSLGDHTQGPKGCNYQDAQDRCA
jgi:exonuclease SbcC